MRRPNYNKHAKRDLGILPMEDRTFPLNGRGWRLLNSTDDGWFHLAPEDPRHPRVTVRFNLRMGAFNFIYKGEELKSMEDQARLIAFSWEKSALP